MYECRICKILISPETFKTDKFCPKCGTLLQLHPLTKYWLFQFNPSIYQWINRIKAEPNDPEQWLTSQHSKHIKKGDLVAIWSAGKKSGIYALGEIITHPARKPLNPNQEKYYIDKNERAKFLEKPSLMVTYSKIIATNPLPQSECHKDSTLLDMQVFIFPQGTNFKLTPEQWSRITELTTQR